VKKQRVTIATCMHQWLAEKGTHWIQPYYVLYAIIFIIVDIISLVQLGKLFLSIMFWTTRCNHEKTKGLPSPLAHTSNLQKERNTLDPYKAFWSAQILLTIVSEFHN